MYATSFFSRTLHASLVKCAERLQRRYSCTLRIVLFFRAFHVSAHLSRVGLGQGYPTLAVKFENFPTGPDPTREISKTF